jgi:hypothetical protein
MQLPLAYLDGSVVEEVSLDLWRKLFQVVGWPESLKTQKKSFNHEEVLSALQGDDLSDELLQAMEALNELGTESGREAIEIAMKDRRVPPEALQLDVGERELPLILFLAQKRNAALAEVFIRAQAQIQDGTDRRRYHEFMGKEAKPVSHLEGSRDTLLDETKRYCIEQGLGDHVQVTSFEDDGAYIFHVLRSHHMKKPLAVVPGHGARATIAYRPVHADTLRYDASVGRLRISVRASSMVEYYRKALGRALFGDPMFFTGEAVCSLKVFQQLGKEALEAHAVAGVGRVRMTECLWERGDGDFLHIRSADCFRNIDELKLPLEEGNILQAKLKLQVVGRSTRPVTVNIRVPSRIEVSNKHHEQLVDEFLTAINVRNTKERTAEDDLWSLYPWRHRIESWREIFGAETDTLIRRGVLVPIRLSSVQAPEHGGAGKVLLAHPIEKGEFYGVSQAPEIPSRSLSATDLDGFELKPVELRLYLRTHLGLKGGTIDWGDSGLLDLGLLDVGDTQFRLIYALRRPQAGTGDRIRAKTAGECPVLLLPVSVDAEAGMPTAPLRESLPSSKEVTRAVIAASGLTNKVPAVFTAPEGSRLVVDSRINKIWIDGVEITGLRAGSHPFRLIDALARACPEGVPMDVLAKELSGARMDGDTTARQAKAATLKAIHQALADAGRSLDEEPIVSGPPGFYRCTLPVHVV